MDVLIVSKAILSKAKEKKIVMKRTKLQKLLYIVYGTYYCYYSKILFDEKPLCYQFGPVFKSVMPYYKDFDFSKTTQINSDCVGEDVQFIIDNVLEIFGNSTAKVLTDLTHSEGSAWFKIKEEVQDTQEKYLRLQDIEEDFRSLMETLYISSIPHLKEQIIEASNAPSTDFIPASEITW